MKPAVAALMFDEGRLLPLEAIFVTCASDAR
jgi:hypothetical protein